MARADAYGLFWQDTPKERNKLKKAPQNWGPMPAFEDNGWRPPSELPNLSAAKVIGFDTETYDPELTEAGPGWGRGKGHIIGASLSVEDGTSWYFPIRHGYGEGGIKLLPPEHLAMNMDPEKVLKFLNSVLNTPVPKVGANAIYDVGWLAWEGVRVSGKIYDIQFAAALLDSETPNVDLDSLALQYLQKGKTTEFLYEWLSRWNGRPANSNQRAHLYATPPMLAGPYGEGDSALPIQILNKQWPEMDRRGVLDLFDLECRLIPLLVAMRLKGAPVNVNSAERIYDELGDRATRLEEKLKEVAGSEINPGSPDSMEKAFKALGLQIPKKLDKASGDYKRSFAKPLLEEIDHPFVELVLEHRKVTKVKDTFVKSYILDKNVNSRLYCTFHPLKSDEGGTRSGRFASSDPNLQNIPVRTDEGKLVRAAFDGTLFGNRWRSFDYSSIEYRLLAHYAIGQGADEVRAIYATDPTADYHKIVGELIKTITGIVLERGPTKTINFGIIYGMALKALAAALKLPMNEAGKLMEDYHKAAPYARATMDMCAKEVHDTGMVRTILNRASDFNEWGPSARTKERVAPTSYQAAAAKWGRFNIERKHTHKALNRKLQGSAADVMKLAMVAAWEAGLFAEDACGIPILTVHDELNWEDKGDLDNPAWDECKRVMENCAAHLLKVPLLVEAGVGPTWREAH